MSRYRGRGPVIVVGSPDDDHVEAVARRLGDEGVEAVVLDTLSFPERTRISLGDDLADVVADGRSIGRPGAVYLRGMYTHPLAFGVGAREAMEHDWLATLTAFREKAAMLRGLLSRWEEAGVPLYNPPSSEWRCVKPMQLAALKAAGLPVPETLWTNDPEAVRRFAAGRRIAYKPVLGGAATREIGPEDLTDERLAALEASPVTFQELLPGEDIRVYVLDGEVIESLRIATSALDYRQNEEEIARIDLPPEVERQCLAAARVLGLRWTGMDLKRDARGTLRILELNDSAMFLGFDARAGTDILGRFASALARAAR
ncbi:hypothetical protein SOCE26_057490 [Sorangium cellulosum]|uniref:ATP-grasp domain-containing protein n=1 Tax=Sorangium cellulosum TaxID=56 RepID=A0A2L0EYE8_SORCE|nr:hypothetical protein [Sorangium cellulosum]AUX44285.1 hypothetical protein SOCE26_057490 [Sorangium cellulosum]